MSYYGIEDLDGFAKEIRHGAAFSFAEDYTENLDDFITIEQTKQIIINHSFDVDENGSHYITEDIFDNIFDDIREAIYQCGLSKLASAGYIECGWDEKTNAMSFWLPSKSGSLDIDRSPA